MQRPPFVPLHEKLASKGSSGGGFGVEGLVASGMGSGGGFLSIFLFTRPAARVGAGLGVCCGFSIFLFMRPLRLVWTAFGDAAAPASPVADASSTATCKSRV